MATINKAEHKRILDLIRTNQLKETLTRLIQEATLLSDWPMQTRLENLQQTYNALLSYAATGADDPGREQILQELRRSAYQITDRFYLYHQADKNYGEFWEKIRARRNSLAPTDYESLFGQLKGATENDSEQTIEERERTADELFYAIWTSISWSEADYQLLSAQFRSKWLIPHDAALLTSAVGQGLLLCFDPYKFLLLAQLYQHHTVPAVTQRALTGLALGIYYHESRLPLYPACEAALKLLAEDTTFIQQLNKLQIQLLMCRETERISAEIRQEIFPDMMKYNLHKPDKQITNLEELEEHLEENPEWKANMDKLSKKVQKLGEMKMEGADTNMPAFTTLKSYPFFSKAPHWFYPFNPEQSRIRPILKKIKGSDMLLRFISRHADFCNSDAYSFLFSIEHISGFGNGQNMLPFDQLEELEKQMDTDSIPAADNPDTLRRHYLQDLYRFYKLWPFKGYQHDIFKDDLALWKCESLHHALHRPEELEQTAHFLFSKGHYAEAISLYTELSELQPTNAEHLQKSGFCFQKQGDYASALEAYQKAALLLPATDTWNNLHLAQCYKQLQQYEEALTCYQQAQEADPDNLNITLQTGHCLIALKQYDEALKHYFKVEFLGKSTANARRAIGWCYFMTRQPEKACQQYRQLLETESKLLPSDYMNTGHTLLVQNQISEALRYYHQAYALNRDDFMEALRADAPSLIEQGVNPTYLELLPDLLV